MDYNSMKKCDKNKPDLELSKYNLFFSEALSCDFKDLTECSYGFGVILKDEAEYDRIKDCLIKKDPEFWTEEQIADSEENGWLRSLDTYIVFNVATNELFFGEYYDPEKKGDIPVCVHLDGESEPIEYFTFTEDDIAKIRDYLPSLRERILENDPELKLEVQEDTYIYEDYEDYLLKDFMNKADDDFIK